MLMSPFVSDRRHRATPVEGPPTPMPCRSSTWPSRPSEVTTPGPPPSFLSARPAGSLTTRALIAGSLARRRLSSPFTCVPTPERDPFSARCANTEPPRSTTSRAISSAGTKMPLANCSVANSDPDPTNWRFVTLGHSFLCDHGAGTLDVALLFGGRLEDARGQGKSKRLCIFLGLKDLHYSSVLYTDHSSETFCLVAKTSLYTRRILSGGISIVVYLF